MAYWIIFGSFVRHFELADGSEARERGPGLSAVRVVCLLCLCALLLEPARPEVSLNRLCVQCAASPIRQQTVVVRQKYKNYWLLLCVLGSTSHQSQTTRTKRQASPLARYLAAPFYRRQNETNYVKVGHLRPELESWRGYFAFLFQIYVCHPRTIVVSLFVVGIFHRPI